MIALERPYLALRIAASDLAFAAHGRYFAETAEQASHHRFSLARCVGDVVSAIASLPREEVAETYLIVDEGGTFREAERGQTRAEVIDDIATGQFEAAQVLRLCGPLCDDVTDAVAEEVLDRLENTGPGRIRYIPGLVSDRCPVRAEALRQSWQTPEERRQDRIDDLRDARNVFILEAAE